MRLLLHVAAAIVRELLYRHRLIRRPELAPHGHVSARVVKIHRYDRAGDTRYV